MPERRGFNPEKEAANEAAAEAERLVPSAAKNLVDGGLTQFALKEAKDITNVVSLLQKGLPLHKGDKVADLFPRLGPGKDLGEGDYEPGMFPAASADASEDLLRDLSFAGLSNELLEAASKRPLLAIRLAEVLNRELVGAEAALEHYREGMTKFYQKLWSELLPKKNIEVPPMPEISLETREAMDRFKMIPMYLPKLTEAEYPKDFVKPKWTQYLTEADIQRIPLVGEWVMVETIKKPNWDDEGGYGAGDADPLARAMNLETRFDQSWDDLHAPGGPLTVAAQELRVESARLPTAEEWNLIANVLLSMKKQGEDFQNLGSTKSWEWFENRYDYDHEEGDPAQGRSRLLGGHSGRGGLAGVGGGLPDYHDGSSGFRVLGRFSK